MGANRNPIYAGAIKGWQGQVSTANTALDGTGTLVDIVVADATNGSRVDLIHIKATVTTSAGMIRLFLYDGTNNRLWHEVVVSVVVPSGTVASFSAEVIPTAPFLLLPAGWKLKASTHNAETFNVSAFGGDFS